VTGYVFVDPPQVERHAVYRYYNPHIVDHMMTSNPSGESFGNPPGWHYEGIGYYLASHEVAGAVPLYRCWRGENRDSDDHMTTTSPDCEGAGDYAREGVLGWIFVQPEEGTVPVYRCYDTRRWADHMSTTSSDCEGGASFWVNEGIRGYVYPGPASGGGADRKAFYRLYNSRIDDHFYTTSPTGEIAIENGYVFEGTEGYLPAAGTAGTVPLFRFWNGVMGDHFYTTDPHGEQIFSY
jgi:hypothetical protein